jgi:hypothetical protein
VHLQALACGESDWKNTFFAKLIRKCVFPYQFRRDLLLAFRETSNQAVMSALPFPERSTIIGISAAVRVRPFAFGCGISLVIYWSA